MKAVISLTRSPSSVSTSIAIASWRPVSSFSAQYATAGCPFALIGTACPLAQISIASFAMAAIVSLPRHHIAHGGIEKTASAARSRVSASTSPLAHASTYRSTSVRTPRLPSARSTSCWLRVGQALCDRLPCALKRTVHGRDGGVERLGHLLRGEPEHLPQDQHRALVPREVLQRRDEGELHGLALLVAGVGRGIAVGEGERVVRIRLHPDGLGERRARIGVRVGRSARAGGKAAARPPRVEADVGRDPVQPRAHRAPAGEPAEPAPRAQERLLKRVLGVVERPEHPVAVRVELPAVGVHDRAVRVLVPRAGGGEPVCFGGGRCRNARHARQGRRTPGPELIARAGAASAVDCPERTTLGG